MQRLVGVVAIALLLLAGCGLRGAGRADAPTLAPGQTPQVPAGATTAPGSPSPAAATAATAAPSPTRPPATSPTPTAPPRLFVRIANTGGLGAYVRAAPTSSASGAVWPEGTVL